MQYLYGTALIMIAIEKIEVLDKGLKLHVKDEPLTMLLPNKNLIKLDTFDTSNCSVEIVAHNPFFEVYMLARLLQR